MTNQAAATPTRKWTVRVYMAGQNRLYDEMIYALKDIKRVAPPTDADVALLAEFGAKWVPPQTVTATQLPTPRRFNLFTRSGYPANSVAKNLVPANQAEPHQDFVEELAQFIKWGVRGYPAQHYMVVFSGDGGGVNSDFLPTLNRPGRKLRAADLTRLFARVNALVGRIVFDIVGFDSCMMSMIEIVHAVRDHARYVIGSQGNEDDLGWPFAEVLEPLVARPAMRPLELVTNTVDKYNTYYLDYALIANSSACLSAFRIDKLSDLTDAVKSFVRASLVILPRTDIDHQTPLDRVIVALYVAAHWEAQTYREDQFADLYDFCERFVKQAQAMIHIHGQIFRGLQQVIDACDRIKTVLCRDNHCDYDAGKAIVTSCSVGTKYQYSHGVSIYFPWNKIDEHYFPGDPYDLPLKPDDFAVKSNWAGFLQRYILCTQKSVRYPLQDSKVLTEDEKRFVETFFRDPPEGKGLFDFELETAKNPPTEWGPSPCVVEPLRR